MKTITQSLYRRLHKRLMGERTFKIEIGTMKSSLKDARIPIIANEGLLNTDHAIMSTYRRLPVVLCTFIRHFSKNFLDLVNRSYRWYYDTQIMPTSQFILSYDIHTPSDSEPELELILEAQKRGRMRNFLTSNDADEVCKSTYVIGVDSTAQKLYDEIMSTVVKEERDGDCVYVAKLEGPIMHTRSIRKDKAEHERMMKIAGISK